MKTPFCVLLLVCLALTKKHRYQSTSTISWKTTSFLKTGTRMSHSFSLKKYQHRLHLTTKGIKIYKSYCAETPYPSVAKLKCDDDCSDPEISFIEFAMFGKCTGTCPEYMPDYCGVDVHSKMNDLCQGKKECKTKVNEDVFGKIQDSSCSSKDLKVLFTCACSPSPPEANKQKELLSDGKKNFLDQMKRVYSDDESMYFMLDKDAALQVFDKEGTSKFTTGPMKSKGEAPFTVELTTKGDFQIQDANDKVLWNTDTEEKGKAPYKVILNDKGKIQLTDSQEDEIWKSK